MLTGVFDCRIAFLVIDSLLVLALIGLAWRSDRRWPFYAIGFQGLAAAVRCGARGPQPHLRQWTYLNAIALAGYGLLAMIVFGTWQTARRRRTPV